MFTRAGFNPDHETVSRGFLHVDGYASPVSAKLIRFVPSGDLAWYARGVCLVWEENARRLSDTEAEAWIAFVGRAKNP